MSLVNKFDEVIGMFGGEDSLEAIKFRKELLKAESTAQADAEWRYALEAGGVDNWEWYGECFSGDEEDEDE